MGLSGAYYSDRIKIKKRKIADVKGVYGPRPITAASGPARQRRDDEGKGVSKDSADALPCPRARTQPANMRATAKQGGCDREESDK